MLGWEAEKAETWGPGEVVGRGLRTGQNVKGLVTHWNRTSCFFSISQLILCEGWRCEGEREANPH